MELVKNKKYYLAMCPYNPYSPKRYGVQQFVYDGNIMYSARLVISDVIDAHCNGDIIAEFSLIDINTNKLNRTFKKIGYSYAICETKEKAYKRLQSMIDKEIKMTELGLIVLQKEFQEKVKVIGFYRDARKMGRKILS